MAPKIIKLGRKDDLASVVKQIKDLRDREVIFDIEKGSVMLKTSDALRLMKKTGEVLGKKIQITTDDEIGQVLAKKAGVLAGDTSEVRMPRGMTRVARSDVKPRFSDILGPPRKAMSKVVEHTQQLMETVGITTMPKSASKISRSAYEEPARPGPNRSKTWIWVLAGIVIVFLGLAIYLPQANVTIYARSEPITRDLEITVDQRATTVDASKLVIPAFPITREVSQTKNFPTTGNNPVGTKATGSVVIYNQTTHTLTLKAATTTLIISGKKYHFTRDVAGIYPTTPSSNNVPVPIIAEQAGADYNLPVNSKFQVVNAALGNQDVYGRNDVAIAGGSATAHQVLSQTDLDQAVASLTNDIIVQAQNDLSQEKSEPIKLIDSGVNKEILAHTANKNVGDEVDKFDMTLIAKVTGLAFSENDVIKLVEGKINEVLSSDKYLVPDAQKQYTAGFKSLDVNKGTGVLTVHFQTVAAYKVDSSNLAKILAGKTDSEIKEILSSKPEVDSVAVSFWPAWLVHKAPRFNGKVYIKTVLSSASTLQ